MKETNYLNLTPSELCLKVYQEMEEKNENKRKDVSAGVR